MKLGGQHLVSHHLFRGKEGGLNEIYLVMTVRSFINSMIGLFVPVYLYQIGYPLFYVILLYLLMEFFNFLLEPIVAFLTAKIGPRHNIAFSLPMLVLHFWMLSNIQTSQWPIWLLALTGSLGIAFFWLPYRYDFTLCKKNSVVSTEVGFENILIALSSAVAPFIGGTIATRLGINFVFGAAIVVLSVITLPILFSKRKHEPVLINFNKIKINKIKRELISFGAIGIDATVGGLIAWGIFVFILLGTYEKIGIITSVALIITILVTYIVSKSADNGERNRFVKVGSFFTAIIYAIKTIASSFFQVMFLNIAHNISHAIFYPAYISEYYLHADEEGKLEYITYMEMAIDFAKVLGLSFLLVLTYFFPVKTVLVIGLILTGFANTLISLMPPAKKELKLENTNIKLIPMLRKKSEVR